jgi:CheY-like chemotaxis protein
MKEVKMDQKIILLVEDNPDDELLTIRTLKKNNIMNEVVIARDGVEALDYLFGTGKFKDRDLNVMPLVILLDLKLPKIDGFEVLKRIRDDKRTKSTPVVAFISSNEEQKLFKSYKMGPNSFVRKPVDFTQFAEAVRQLDLRWIVLREEDILYETKMETEETEDVEATTDDVLFTSISPTPESEKVFGLGVINPRLSELISNLSDEEIQELIEELEKRQESKFHEKREHQRKPTLIYVDCSGKNYTFTDFIQNISSGGIYIETQIPLHVDHELSMTFTLPGTGDPLKITGRVVRTDPNGIAVRFDEPLPHL